MKEDNNYIGAKYYSEKDLSLGANLETAKCFLRSHSNLVSCATINEILELFNILKLLRTNLTLKQWDENDMTFLQNRKAAIPAVLGRFSGKVSGNNLVRLFRDTAFLYREDFFEYIEQYKIYERISEQSFYDLLNLEEAYDYLFVSRRKLVEYYDSVIARHMREKPLKHAETIIRAHLEKPRLHGEKIFIPKALSPEDKRAVLNKYIESEEANPNYLQLIALSQDDNDLLLDAEVRLKAKKAFESWIGANGSRNAILSYKIEVSFDYIDTDYCVDLTDGVYHYTYSKQWIENNTDYATIMQNFITLFDYADIQSRMLLVAYESEIGALEKHLGVKGKNDYLHGSAFDYKSYLSTLQMIAYEKQLAMLGIRIEEVYSWFFSEYLVKEFGVQGFSFQAPNEKSSFREKNRDLLAELDGVLKQYDLFSRHGEVDRELLEMTSASPSLDSLKSLCKSKYGYAQSQDFLSVLFMLFSDQSHLAYNSVTKDNYRTLAELLLRSEVRREDFERHQIDSIDWLIEKGVLAENRNKVLRIDPIDLSIYWDLYHREVLCLNYVRDFPLVKSLIETEQLVPEDTLFSIPEQNYLSFMLNKQKFSNGKDLRNRYMHGSNTVQEKQQQSDYYNILKIIALIIIKMNQEFCFYDEEKRSGQTSPE